MVLQKIAASLLSSPYYYSVWKTHLQIATVSGEKVNRKTVSRTLKRGGAPPGIRCQHRSILDPYCGKLDELMASNVWNGKVMLRELQALGYPGSYTVMNHYVRPFRCARRCQSRATVRYETGPGEQLQHDWAQCWVTMAGIERKVFFAVNTLGYSRRFHVVAGFSLDAEHTDESLVQSFTYFGGVPRTVLVDNQKAAVLSHTPQGIRFHPRFLDLAGHYGFTPKACRPYRARTKGKMERRVRYVKEHFFVRYPAFESVAHLNQQLLGISPKKWTVELRALLSNSSGLSPPVKW